MICRHGLPKRENRNSAAKGQQEIKEATTPFRLRAVKHPREARIDERHHEEKRRLARSPAEATADVPKRASYAPRRSARFRIQTSSASIW
jgi:hypothetical protein